MSALRPRQAAWALTGEKPAWTVDMDTRIEPDAKPVVREQYRAATEQLYS